MPNVARKNPTNGWYRLRWVVLRRDNYACQYCGQKAPNIILEVDHIMPVCEGGTDDLDNLVTSCTACNIGKEAERQTEWWVAKREMEKVSAPPVGPTRREVILEALVTPMELAELAEATGLEKDVLSNALSRAKRRGLVARGPDRKWRIP